MSGKAGRLPNHIQNFSINIQVNGMIFFSYLMIASKCCQKKSHPLGKYPRKNLQQLEDEVALEKSSRKLLDQRDRYQLYW
jgi:hypothetical protein